MYVPRLLDFECGPEIDVFSGIDVVLSVVHSVVYSMVISRGVYYVKINSGLLRAQRDKILSPELRVGPEFSLIESKVQHGRVQNKIHPKFRLKMIIVTTQSTSHWYLV